MTNIIGIDPSLTATGYANYKGEVTFKTKPKDGDRRLNEIASALHFQLWQEDVALAVVEDLPVHAHSAGRLGMVQGIVRWALNDQCVPYVLVPPATLKKYATGKGNCDKAAMREAYVEVTGHDNKDDNQVDAFFLRLIGLDLKSRPGDALLGFHSDTLDRSAIDRYRDESL